MPRNTNIRTGTMRSGGSDAPPTFYRNGHAWQSDGQHFVCVTCKKAFDRRDHEQCAKPTTSGKP